MAGAAAPRLTDPLFTTAQMSFALDDAARVQAMLDFEAALARAEARVGVIPPSAAASIVAGCNVTHFDLHVLAAGAAPAGNLAIPMVKALTAHVARHDPAAARFVHWGATSQDAIDTGLVLQLRRVLDLLDADYARLARALRELGHRHAHTVLAARTWLQQAVPTTVGAKAAVWLSAIERDRERLQAVRSRALVLQFGGAAGTLASIAPHGIAVSEAIGEILGLAVPDVPWHTARDRVAEFAAVLGIAIGTLGKIARDIALMMQTEVGEAFEPAGAGVGGSSAMPHKRNPVSAAVVLAAAIRAPGLVATMLSAMVQEHERGLGNWPAEWETLPELARLAAGALGQMLHVISGLELDPGRMQSNLGITRGLLSAERVAIALGTSLGKQQAHHLVEAACRDAVAQRRHLRDVLAEADDVRSHLDGAKLDELFDPALALGLAADWIGRIPSR